jgi:hypothetical protein
MSAKNNVRKELVRVAGFDPGSRAGSNPQVLLLLEWRRPRVAAFATLIAARGGGDDVDDTD